MPSHSVVPALRDLMESSPPGSSVRVTVQAGILDPNTLHVDTVGSVTSPVTQVEVVAVKSASRYGTDSPLAELIGNAKSPLPIRMVTRKLNNMTCVVERVNFFFLTIRFSSEKHKGTNVLCSQLVPFIIVIFYDYIIFCRFCQYFLHKTDFIYALREAFIALQRQRFAAPTDKDPHPANGSR